MKTGEFLKQISRLHATGQASEHSYRTALEILLSSADPTTTVINEPRRIECGAPDFVVMRNDMAIGHVEAKNIDVDLKNMSGKDLKQKKTLSQRASQSYLY